MRTRSDADPPSPSARHWSVRTYLIGIVLAAVVAVAAASAYGFLWSAGAARDEATQEMSLEAQRAASSVSSSIAAAEKMVLGLAAQPGLSAVFQRPEGCTLSAEGLGAFPEVRLDIVAPGGRVACSSIPAAVGGAKAVHRGSGWLRSALRAEAAEVHWNARDAVADEPAVVVAVPLRDGTAAVGAVALLMRVPGSARALARDVAGFEHGSFTIIDRAANTVLSASEASGGASGEPRFEHSSSSGAWTGVDGSQRIFGSARVPGSDWQIYAGVRESEVLADARGALTRYLAVGLLALLVLAIAVWALNRRVAGPLRAVTEAVVRASRDAEGTRVAETGSAELVALAREFNSMLDVRAGHDAQLAHQATHDPLTGLPNRVLFYEHLDQALDGHEGDIAVVFIGLNRLHFVNDGFGHDATDRVLREVSERLSTVMRQGDMLARFDGEQFVVLCEGGHAENAGEVAERLRRCVDQPFRGPGSDIVLQVSIGIAVAEGSTSPDQLLREAHTAMREAMSTGRDWCRFDDELQIRATEHLAIEHALWQALERKEFVVHYQPLLEVATGRIVGTEALVRWLHPERGLVPPLEFIPIAEATGQIMAVGQFVLVEACTQAARWAAAGHSLRMSVNVTVDQLRQEDFPDFVREVLSDTGLAPEQLCLEITESSLVRATTQGSSALAALKRVGVHLAIDDFGTGYSSLSYLHDLPVDEIKIDRSFIGRLDRDASDEHLVDAIIGMTQALDLAVVAEGVETNHQLDILARLGCEMAQGYLFAPPQSADGLNPLIEAARGRGKLALVS